jgi:hypothetical protein
MAYTEVKADYPYRLILGVHNLPVASSQLSRDCTGLVLEHCTGTQADFYRYFINRDIQCKSLISKAWVRGIPVINAEPEYKPSYWEDPETGSVATIKIDSFGGLRKALALVSIYPSCAKIALSSKEMGRESSSFGELQHKMQKFISTLELGFNSFPIDTRNLLMALYTKSFADLQRQQGIAPRLNLVAGVGHYGLVDVLKADKRELIERILDDKRVEKYISDESLRRGYYVNCSYGSWVAGIFPTLLEECFNPN